MEISASRSVRRFTVSVCALAALAAGATAAAAEPAPVDLRVQSEQRTLVSGQTYLTDRTGIVTDTLEPSCGGSGEATTVEGPTALSVLVDAAGVNRALRPLGITDKFDFGLLVCAIGGTRASDEAFWLYKVNHVAPEVGADQQPVGAGDEVLWYYSNTANGRNTGDELSLDAPARANASGSFDVRVTAYDFAGKRTPAANAIVRYGRERVTTDEDGVARVTAGEGGGLRLRAVRGVDVASAVERVCVADTLSDCPATPGLSLNGTGDGDRLKGTKRPDLVRAYGGNDRIDVRGGGRDIVRCGRGRDVVLMSGRDFAARDCEIVNTSSRVQRRQRG